MVIKVCDFKKKLRNSNQEFIKIGKYSAIYDNIFGKYQVWKISFKYTIFFDKNGLFSGKKGYSNIRIIPPNYSLNSNISL